MPRILCVDDDPAVLMATEEVLEEAGYEVVGVRNAEAARSVLARGGIDLVVSDYRLPGASGLELGCRGGPTGPTCWRTSSAAPT